MSQTGCGCGSCGWVVGYVGCCTVHDMRLFRLLSMASMKQAWLSDDARLDNKVSDARLDAIVMTMPGLMVDDARRILQFKKTFQTLNKDWSMINDDS